MKFFEKLKKVYAYYKELGKEAKPQKLADLDIRPDYFAFLTAPYPVLPNEKKYKERGNYYVVNIC